MRVAAFAQGDKARDAEAAGAGIVGADDLATKIEEGFDDFDLVIATPDMMPKGGNSSAVLDEVSKTKSAPTNGPNVSSSSILPPWTQEIRSTPLRRPSATSSPIGPRQSAPAPQPAEESSATPV